MDRYCNEQGQIFCERAGLKSGIPRIAHARGGRVVWYIAFGLTGGL